MSSLTTTPEAFIDHYRRGCLVLYRKQFDDMNFTNSPLIASRNHTRSLVSLRNTLLPKLLSGNLSVAKAVISPPVE